MSAREPTEDSFLKDVKDHKMTILRDDGANRHLRFREPGTYCFGFDIITWPGFLCIAGDCGTYVFQRLEDMFIFFRMSPDDLKHYPDRKLNINPSYWGEKLQSVARNGGYEEYSGEKLRAAVKRHFDQHYEDDIAEEKLLLEDPEADPEKVSIARFKRARRNIVWEEIENEILSVADDEHRGPAAVHDFNHEGFYFQDFFETRIVDYTFHYIWNLYAIVWGIQQYDKAKEPAAKSTVTI